METLEEYASWRVENHNFWGRSVCPSQLLILPEVLEAKRLQSNQRLLEHHMSLHLCFGALLSDVFEAPRTSVGKK